RHIFVEARKPGAQQWRTFSDGDKLFSCSHPPPLYRCRCSPSTLDKLLPALPFTTATPVITLLLNCTIREIPD
ncbi:hypothetical protein KUCAC02_011014, partial [Chaenocephalus aceratus]